MFSTINYKMLASFLVGALVGCSVDMMLERLMSL